MEQVILVDENDSMYGTMEKMEAHKKGVLHRAFSIFIFNGKGQLLMQQRAAGKYHSAGLWTNTCCSHPRPGEDTTVAALRRLEEEMGFVTSLDKAFDFTYRSVFDNGLTEHEFDHVMVGYYDGSFKPDPAEVSNYAYWDMEEAETMLQTSPELFTTWFHIAFPAIKDWCRTNKVL